jgi:hypothetical protein
MNAPFKQNIQMYREKIGQADQQDQMSIKRFNDQQSELAILSKTPQELLFMMPKSVSAEEIASRPCAVAIKAALDNFEKAKLKKEELVNEAVMKLSNLNSIEALMAVHQG